MLLFSPAAILRWGHAGLAVEGYLKVSQRTMAKVEGDSAHRQCGVGQQRLCPTDADTVDQFGKADAQLAVQSTADMLRAVVGDGADL